MNIYGQTFSQLEQYFMELGENKAKAKPLFQGLYRDNIRSFLELQNLRDRLKQRLYSDFELELPRIITQEADGDAIKFLFVLTDGHFVEAVLMRQRYGNSLCISTQVGCNMGCRFCQSGRLKKMRNLEVCEMMGQVMAIQLELSHKISNVVLMGIGEPFDNYKNVMDFLSILNHQQGLDIGKRHIALSTCGIVPRIYDYMRHPSAGLLAISLHASNDKLRAQLMPIDRVYPLKELKAAIDAYIAHTGKKVMLEYVMLKDINDSIEHARELIAFIGESRCHVNLIPYNETQNLGFIQSSRSQTMAFYDVLKKNGVMVTLRREFGTSVKAACGQLRADYQHQTRN